MNEDELPSADDFERMINHEEMVWEVWYRLFMFNAMQADKSIANRRMYMEYFRKRANRSPEDWYGTPGD